MKYGYDRDERELKLIVKECAELTHTSRDRLNGVTKKWAELFLKNWNRAVQLWNDGHMFKQHQGTGQYEPYQLRDQQEYARICCSWVLPNGLQEPHVVAEGG